MRGVVREVEAAIEAQLAHACVGKPHESRLAQPFQLALGGRLALELADLRQILELSRGHLPPPRRRPSAASRCAPRSYRPVRACASTLLGSSDWDSPAFPRRPPPAAAPCTGLRTPA